MTRSRLTGQMKKIGLLVLILGLPLAAAAWDAASAHDRASLERFVGVHVAPTAAPSFSFVYGGKPASSLLPGWTITVDTDKPAGKIVKTVSYVDPATKLRVTAVYTIYADFPAVEWVFRMKNQGAADTPIIEDVQACAAALTGLPAGPLTLYRALGSSAQRTDFAPVQDDLGAKAEVTFGPSSGRSSDTTALPFFNIAAPGQGVMAAIGWSGKWRAVVKRAGADAVELRAGMDQTHFKLHPGEEVRSPSIALLFWKAPDRLAGHNLFRRFILAHHTPLIDGQPATLPLSHGVGYGGPFPCNEYVCATESYAIAMIERLKQFGLEVDDCWIDAGWFENATKHWWEGVGNWTVNKANFPRGLRPVTDVARQWGKGFVVWFEPERVYPGTWLDREHPEWLTKLPGIPNRLLNLGDPHALDWLTNHISDFIKTEGVTVYRQDFNFDPYPYWQAMDTPDRVGIAEIKHITGLYAYWDALLARNPGLLIDNCASGGRRLDLETTSRSVPLWRTDYSYFEPNGYQCHTYGLQLYLPSSGTGNNNPLRYNFRSSANGAVVCAWELNGQYNSAAFSPQAAREDIAEFKELRPYYRSDFYPLTEYSTSDEAWAAFQWDRPEEKDGIILVFRRNWAPNPTITIKPHELAPDADYEVNFADYGITLFKSGKELAAGLSVKIADTPGSLLIKYRRVR
jgi:alpha-galactosidase